MATIKREVGEGIFVQHSAGNGHHLTVWDLREFARACAEAGIPDKEKVTVTSNHSTLHKTGLYVRVYRPISESTEPKEAAAS